MTDDVDWRTIEVRQKLAEQSTAINDAIAAFDAEHAAALREAIATSNPAPQWTCEIPTVPGWYWMRLPDFPSNEPWCVKVEIDGAEWIAYCPFVGGSFFGRDDYPNAEWWSVPMQVPQ